MTSEPGKPANGAAGSAAARTAFSARDLPDPLTPPQKKAIRIEAAGPSALRLDIDCPERPRAGERAGEAALFDSEDGQAALSSAGGGVLGLFAPREVLRGCGIDIERLTARPSSVQDNAALRMLIAYLEIMGTCAPDASSPLAECANRHIAELLALAAGRRTDMREDAREGARNSLRAARLGAIRRAIAAQAHRPDFSIDELGQTLALSPRYIQRILHEEGTTFSAQVTEHRLDLACRALTETREGLADIAFRCGFGDLSVFYRAFKRKFGMAPGRFRRA